MFEQISKRQILIIKAFFIDIDSGLVLIRKFISSVLHIKYKGPFCTKCFLSSASFFQFLDMTGKVSYETAETTLSTNIMFFTLCYDLLVLCTHEFILRVSINS